MAELKPSGAILLTLVVGTTGGALFNAWGLPLPWMLGSMIFVSACAVLGLPVRRSMPLRNTMIVVLGILLGSFFTPGVFSNLTTWGGALLVMLVYVIVTTTTAVLIFRGLGYMDATTAYFSSTPGGLGIMVIAGEEAGADSRLIPIAHATRVFLVVFSIPLYFVTVVGVDVPSISAFSTSATSYPDFQEFILLLGCGLGGFWLANRIDLAFGRMLIPMVLSGTVYYLDLVNTPLPTPLFTVAQVVIGSAIGAQFRGMRLLSMFRVGIAAVAATAIMLLLAAGFAKLFSPILNISEDALLLALAPGGLAEMSLIAIAINSDTPFIATLHIFRITMIAAAGPILFRLLRKLSNQTPRKRKNS